jgi:tetratricopeptide (TPR) repeat protein
MSRSLFDGVSRAGLALLLLSVPAQICSQAGPGASSIEGKVCDTQNRLLPGATVILETPASTQSASTTADAQGHFRFSKIVPGTYTLRAHLRGFADASEGPFSLQDSETKFAVLRVQKADAVESGESTAADIPFSDETHFTVAGVTDTTSLGGHGSDPVRRNSDALSKDAAKLSEVTESAVLGEEQLRERISKEDSADLRFQLAEIEEKSGRSLEAVRDYQHAAEMDPSEPHLFAWGAELLLHRALDPSIEVFAKGRRVYPGSVRMVLGLASAWYARGPAEEAKQLFLAACDIAPSDQTPYLFLGKVQVTENTLPDGWTNRLKRFADLYPENALAHYFYAVALIKAHPEGSENSLVESQLNTAVQLDPHLGDACLELGNLAAARGDLPKAIGYFQEAIANTPLPDDAHYRLAQAYRRMGDTEKARQQSELYKQISEKKTRQVERERHELQQFVYTLREQQPSPQNVPAPK